MRISAAISRQEAPRREADRIVRTVCSPNCTGSCGIKTHVRDDRIIRVEPADFPEPEYRRICLKGIAMAMQRVDHPDRIRYPLRRKGPRGCGEWERMSWDEALDHLAGRLAGIASEYGSRANSWISMTGNYGIIAMMLSSRVANCLGGTAFTNLGLMGDLGANMGFLPALGVHQEAHDWPDISGSRLIVLFGKNMAETEHSDMHFLFDAIEKGACVVVVDPRYSRTASKAHQWISLRPGTDAALVLGMLNVIVREGLFDEEYVKLYTNAPFLVRTDNGKLLREHDLVRDGGDGFMVLEGATERVVPALLCPTPKLRGSVTVSCGNGTPLACRTAFDVMLDLWRNYTPGRAAWLCEVPAEVIEQLARNYATTRPASLWVGQGSQRYYHGHLAYRAAITLAALCGNIGRRHAGVSWGGGTLLRMILGTPQGWLCPGGRRGATYPGTRMFDIIATGRPYPIKSLWVHNYGFGTQSPRRRQFIGQILPQLELFVVSEQMMTEAARHADFVLPTTSYYEDEADLVGSWNNRYIQLRAPAIPPIGESRTDWQIFKELCIRMGHGEGWEMSAEESCEYILRHCEDPLVSSVDWQELKEKGVALAGAASPRVPFADLKFPTPSGRIELYTEQLKDFDQAVLVFKEPLESNRRPKAREYPLTLMTTHQMHTVHGQHVMLPWIRELLPGPRLEMNPVDAAPRSIAEGDMVAVYNDRGRLRVRATLTEAIKPGAVNLPQGWWPKDFAEGHYSDLSHVTPNPVQEAILETNFPPFDNLVEIRKEGGRP